MNIFRDEATGYLVLSDITGGFHILSDELYRKQSKRLSELESENRELRAVNMSMQQALTQASLAQSEAVYLQKASLNAGLALGIFGQQAAYDGVDIEYWLKVFRTWYSEAIASGQLSPPPSRPSLGSPCP